MNLKKLLLTVACAGLMAVTAPLMLAPAEANHSGPSNLDPPFTNRCSHTATWPDRNPPGPTNTSMILDFDEDADVYGSPWYIGGNGTSDDPALIHVPGCLKIFIRVTNITIHAGFIDMSYWVMNPPNATTASSMGLPSECTPRDSVFCIHDLQEDGLVTIRDFFLDHGGVLLNALNATVYLEQSTWEEVAKSGSLGSVHENATVELHQVFWYGMTRIDGGQVKLVLSSLHAVGSWCMTTAPLPPVSPPPINALPLGSHVMPHGNTSQVYEPILGSLSPPPYPIPLTDETNATFKTISQVGVPEWFGRGLDELWAENIEWRERAVDRHTYVPAIEGEPPEISLIMFNLTPGSEFKSMGSRVGGAFITVLSEESIVESVDTEYGCGAYGIASYSSNITSLQSTFRDVAFPYKLNNSDDIWHPPHDYAYDVVLSPNLGTPISDYQPPLHPFISVCDVFRATHPAAVLSNRTVNLFGTNFMDGIPIHARHAINGSSIYGGLDNLVPFPDNVEVRHAAHDDLNAKTCGGPYMLDHDELVPDPVLPSFFMSASSAPGGTCVPAVGAVLASIPASIPTTGCLSSSIDCLDGVFPCYNLLDGAGNKRYYLGTTIPVIGLVNVPLVSPDLSSVHYLVALPNPTSINASRGFDGITGGFYNFHLGGGSRDLPLHAGTMKVGPMVPGTASGGYGVHTKVQYIGDLGVLSERTVKYWFKEASFAEVCVDCSSLGGLLVRDGPSDSWESNALTTCLTLALDSRNLYSVAERAATNCGETGTGTKGVEHYYRDDFINFNVTLTDRNPRRVPITVNSEDLVFNCTLDCVRGASALTDPVMNQAHVSLRGLGVELDSRAVDNVNVKIGLSQDVKSAGVDFWGARLDAFVLQVLLSDVDSGTFTFDINGDLDSTTGSTLAYRPTRYIDRFSSGQEEFPGISEFQLVLPKSSVLGNDSFSMMLSNLEGPKNLELRKGQDAFSLELVSTQPGAAPNDADMEIEMVWQSAQEAAPLELNGVLEHWLPRGGYPRFETTLASAMAPKKTYELNTTSGALRDVTLSFSVENQTGRLYTHYLTNVSVVLPQKAHPAIEYEESTYLNITTPGDTAPGWNLAPSTFLAAELQLNGTFLNLSISNVRAFKDFRFFMNKEVYQNFAPSGPSAGEQTVVNITGTSSPNPPYLVMLDLRNPEDDLELDVLAELLSDNDERNSWRVAYNRIKDPENNITEASLSSTSSALGFYDVSVKTDKADFSVEGRYLDGFQVRKSSSEHGGVANATSVSYETPGERVFYDASSPGYIKIKSAGDLNLSASMSPIRDYKRIEFSADDETTRMTLLSQNQSDPFALGFNAQLDDNEALDAAIEFVPDVFEAVNATIFLFSGAQDRQGRPVGSVPEKEQLPDCHGPGILHCWARNEERRKEEAIATYNITFDLVMSNGSIGNWSAKIDSKFFKEGIFSGRHVKELRLYQGWDTRVLFKTPTESSVYHPSYPAFVRSASPKFGSVDVDIASLTRGLVLNLTYEELIAKYESGGPPSRVVVAVEFGDLGVGTAYWNVTLRKEEQVYAFDAENSYLNELIFKLYKGDVKHVDVNVTNLQRFNFDKTHAHKTGIYLEPSLAHPLGRGTDIHKLWIKDIKFNYNLNIEAKDVNLLNGTLDLKKNQFYTIHELNLEYTGWFKVEIGGDMAIHFKKIKADYASCVDVIHYELTAVTIIPPAWDTRHAGATQTVSLEDASIAIARITTVNHTLDEFPAIPTVAIC
jgi:hypothetical protein